MRLLTTEDVLNRPKGQRYEAGCSREFIKLVREKLPYMDFAQATEFYTSFLAKVNKSELAFLGANDRYFLLTSLLNRDDAIHPWIYTRCREVELRTDGFLDLWARGHYKSTVITFAGTIQEAIIDPEIRIGIFSNTKDISRPFVSQIQEELETNELLKEVYDDIFWANPRKDSPSWSPQSSTGLIIKRKTNPKEGTWEAHGLIDSMPTGRHFPLLVFDDVITEKNVASPEQIQKATQKIELSDNLGNVIGLTRKWFIGTRYSFADTYGILIEHEIATPRLHPATHNGRIDGIPVMLSHDQWQERVRSQRTTVAAQMLQNPLAGQENTFSVKWLLPYHVRPLVCNVYILVDPSAGRHKTSDRTAMAVVGIDPSGNKFLLDGYCHRMDLSERWKHLKFLHKKWSNVKGVRMLRVGYERYGMQTDVEHFQERMRQEGKGFEIEEVAWTSERGLQSKEHRVMRLEPDFRFESFFVPSKVHHSEHGVCVWRVDEDTEEIVLSPYKGAHRLERSVLASGEGWRVVEPLKRKDEDNNIYDCTRVFFEEYRFFPFSPRDDFIDAMSRIYDMEPTSPSVHDSISFDELETWEDD